MLFNKFFIYFLKQKKENKLERDEFYHGSSFSSADEQLQYQHRFLLLELMECYYHSKVVILWVKLSQKRIADGHWWDTWTEDLLVVWAGK